MPGQVTAGGISPKAVAQFYSTSVGSWLSSLTEPRVGSDAVGVAARCSAREQKAALVWGAVRAEGAWA